MTIGEKLLDLTTEYQESVVNRSGWADVYGDGPAAGREPSVIAAEYEIVLREALSGRLSNE